MKLDKVSKNLLVVALCVDRKINAFVPEIWIEEKIVEKLRGEAKKIEVSNHIEQTSKLIDGVQDKRRKIYLQSLLNSMQYLLIDYSKKNSYKKFSKKVFGYRIDKVTEKEIQALEGQIRNLENEIGMTRLQVYQKHKISNEKVMKTANKFVENIKNKLPKYILDYPDEGFEVKPTRNKPWAAYNHHTASFKSTISINLDHELNNKLDLYKLASHEAYAGHHSELSQKDKLLVEHGHGEHGLIMNYSPQIFISEAIAEGMYVILGIRNNNNKEELMAWYYDRLFFAVQNLAAHLYIEDNLTREEIRSILNKYYISERSIENILDFSTDAVYCYYAPVYYSAYNFIKELYKNTDKKEELIRTLFTQPCTPDLIREEFIS